MSHCRQKLQSLLDLHAAGMHAVVAIATANFPIGLQLPLLCHVLSACWGTCNFVSDYVGAYHEGLGPKRQAGTKDSSA